MPKDRVSEFFAFISVSARFAGIFGPLVFGLVAQMLGESRLSILFLIAFFAIGIVMLGKLDVKAAQAAANKA